MRRPREEPRRTERTGTATRPPARHYPRIAREPRDLGANTALLTGLSLAALAACVKIGEDVFSHETAPFDEPVRAFMLDHQHEGVRRFFLVVTHVGSPRSVIGITAAMAFWLRRRLGLPIAASVVLAPAIAMALFVAIKLAYHRARPAGAERLHERTFAFPSGHAAASAALCGTLGYVLWREELVSGRGATLLGTMPTLFIGTSRLYLDVHWPTDVAGGWALGAFITAMSAFVYERRRLDTRKHGMPALSGSQTAG